ncbi:hypothetical protein IE81DRAFT_349070 [Ceraceosorus guamensis]|uniref:Uncharacterized protein n=1 Tax=Ceraceosorus guamensis TaxID=1522189 RepID=A0A316VT87_9BASI|nr:hypothetical protein IE81DRAFT_349070 [Ceraceosorus guamensis]PWN40590.1 hypothetical protein IE81DRAFT_349070 [Ceraceosorus guamensis]
MKLILLSALLVSVFVAQAAGQERSKIKKYSVIHRPAGWTDGQVSNAWVTECKAIGGSTSGLQWGDVACFVGPGGADLGGQVISALEEQNPGEWEFGNA